MANDSDNDSLFLDNDNEFDFGDSVDHNQDRKVQESSSLSGLTEVLPLEDHVSQTPADASVNAHDYHQHNIHAIGDTDPGTLEEFHLQDPLGTDGEVLAQLYHAAEQQRTNVDSSYGQFEEDLHHSFLGGSARQSVNDYTPLPHQDIAGSAGQLAESHSQDTDTPGPLTDNRGYFINDPNHFTHSLHPSAQQNSVDQRTPTIANLTSRNEYHDFAHPHNVLEPNPAVPVNPYASLGLQSYTANPMHELQPELPPHPAGLQTTKAKEKGKGQRKGKAKMFDLGYEEFSINDPVYQHIAAKHVGTKPNQPTKTSYSSVAAAERAVAARIQGRNTYLDDTYPSTAVMETRYFARLLNACLDSEIAEDGATVRSQWNTAMTKSMEQIEESVWLLIGRMKKYHSREGLLVAYNSYPSTVTKVARFEEHVQRLCYAFVASKTICRKILGPDYIDQLIDDSYGTIKRTRSNRKVNDDKRIKTIQGREACEAIERLKNPEGSAPIDDDEDDHPEEREAITISSDPVVAAAEPATAAIASGSTPSAADTPKAAPKRKRGAANAPVKRQRRASSNPGTVAGPSSWQGQRYEPSVWRPRMGLPGFGTPTPRPYGPIPLPNVMFGQFGEPHGVHQPAYFPRPPPGFPPNGGQP